MIFFLPKSAKSIASPLSEAKTQWMVNWLQFLKQLNFVWRHTNVIQHVSEMFNSWERRWIDVDGASHTLSATAAIFSGAQTVFGFSRFGLLMRMPVSFTFSQANEHMELTVLLFFQNPILHMIFKVMLQYFPALFKRIHNHIRSTEG